MNEWQKKWHKRMRPVRWLLTLLLIYGVWTETGIWTATAMFLGALSIELLCQAIEYLIEAIREKPIASKAIYVSPRGDDANDGLSIQDAKQTIAAAVDVVGTNDIVVHFGG